MIIVNNIISISHLLMPQTKKKKLCLKKQKSISLLLFLWYFCSLLSSCTLTHYQVVQFIHCSQLFFLQNSDTHLRRNKKEINSIANLTSNLMLWILQYSTFSASRGNNYTKPLADRTIF